jgi:GTPase SAR1 family protein
MDSIFRPAQRYLADLLNRLRDVAGAVQDPSVADIIDTQQERVARHSFKVLVMGQFDTGKTTLMNALLGASVFPSYMGETTAVPCEIKYTDEQPFAVLYPSDGSPSFTVSIDMLSDRLVVPVGGKNPNRKAVLYWPLDLCQDGVEIVDSPGLDAAEHRDEILIEYLHNADAIVFVTRESGALGLGQMSFLKRHVFTQVHADSTFCVINWMTSDDSGRDRVMTSVRHRLATISEDGQPPRADRLFVVNAKRALDAQLTENAYDLEISGVPEFKDVLQNFLIRDRGSSKLRSSAHVLGDCMQKLKEDIEVQRSMYERKLTSLIDSYEAEKPRIRELEKLREKIVNDVERHIDGIASSATEEVHRFLQDLARQFPSWAASSQPVARFNPRASGDENDIFVQEVVESVWARYQEAELEWERMGYRTLLAQQLVELEKSIRSDVQDFMAGVYDVRRSIGGSDAPELDIQEAVSRVLTDVGDLQIRAGLDTSSLLVEPPGGGLVPNLVRLSPFAFIFVHPIVSTLAVPVANWVAGILERSDAGEKAKIKIGEALRETFEEGISAGVGEFRSQLTPALRELYSNLDDRLSSEVKTITSQVETVIRSMRAGTGEMSRNLAALNLSAQEIRLISESYRELVEEIDQMASN